jgi:hypothetical protein
MTCAHYQNTLYTSEEDSLIQRDVCRDGAEQAAAVATVLCFKD